MKLLFTLLFLVGAALALRAAPGTVRFRDAETKRMITLVGAMHYNPASIATARQAVVASAREGELGAVVVESCVSRWNRSVSVASGGSSLGALFPSEMGAAAEEAAAAGVALSLGDVDVGDLGPRLRALLKASVADLASPAGWTRIARDLRRSARLAFDASDLGDDALQVSGFVSQPGLLVPGFFVSLARYPLAAAVKAPLPFGALVVGMTALQTTADSVDAAVAAGQSSPELLALSLVLLAAPVLSFPIVTRIFLVGLLEERNLRLARSIREAARKGDVVAVLGGLHVNGVARLLLAPEPVPTASDGNTAAGTWWVSSTATP